MLRFDLPLVHQNIQVKDALPDIIDSGTSGLLFEVDTGELRLLHYNDLLAVADPDRQIQDIKFELVENIVSVPDSGRIPHMRALNRHFGFAGMGPRGAILYSVSESYGIPYTYSSGGVRCNRPNRPAATPPKQWYHYYPPHTLDNHNPSICKLCGASIP